MLETASVHLKSGEVPMVVQPLWVRPDRVGERNFRQAPDLGKHGPLRKKLASLTATLRRGKDRKATAGSRKRRLCRRAWEEQGQQIQLRMDREA